MKIIKIIGNWFIELFDRKGRRSKKIAQFCHYNKKLLIIVADPKTDSLFMSYNDKMVLNKIKSAEGKKMKVIKGVLSHSKFKKEVDNFLTAIMDSLQLSLKNGNQFYSWVDGALCSIARVLRMDRKVKKENKKINNNLVDIRDRYKNDHNIPVA